MKKILKAILAASLCASMLMLTSCMIADEDIQQSQSVQEVDQPSSQEPITSEPVSEVSQLPSSQEPSSQPSSVEEESYPDYSEYDETAKSIFNDYMNDQMHSSLSGEERLKDYRIDYLEVRNADESGFQFYIEYDILPEIPEEFILAGNGDEGDDGWYIDIGRYITVQKQGEDYIITSISMSPSF